MSQDVRVIDGTQLSRT